MLRTPDVRRPAPSALLMGAALAFIGVTALAAPAPRAPSQPIPRIDFNRDIRPILSQNCFACHGVDAGKRAAGLRLDTEAGMREALPSGRRAVFPGNPGGSELWKRVTAANALKMPPESTGKRLKSAEVAKLRRWITEGAPFAPHWSYAPVSRPALPAVKTPGWALNPVDRFILAQLEQAGVKPSPEAGRATLLRRVSLDLIGLPPTPVELDAFLADKTPQAYEKAVDRLLSSPHYGERMAQYWLDLVRYADTVGYHGDQNFTVWPYRDYVIRSFGANKPFDEFTREQIAGDLLPGSTDKQKVASGYNRLGMMSAEGGVQDKEYRAKYAAERVRNTSTVWLGATLGCAECHDHKYDPLTTREFYSFAAFFADLREKGFYDGGYSRGDWGPSLRLPTPEQRDALARMEAEIEAAGKSLGEVPASVLARGQADWEARILALDAAQSLGWQTLTPVRAAGSRGSELTIQADGAVAAGGPVPAFETYEVTFRAPAGPITGLRLEVLPDGSLPGNGVARTGHYFVLSEVEAALEGKPVTFASALAALGDEGYPPSALIDGRPDTGWAVVHGGGGVRTAVLRTASPLKGKELTVRLRHETVARLLVGKFRLSATGVETPDLSADALPAPVLAVLRKAAASRTPAERERIADHYRTVAPELQPARDRLARLEGDRSILLGRIPHTLVSEAGEPKVMRVLPRGNWMDDTGEIVQPVVPAALGSMKVEGRPTRLDLANWLTARANPLTARVFVNRLWKLFYGVGLAKNVDDFGAQGEPPVHPKLLDWLADEFARTGWDVRRMVRLLVTTRAYRQSSAARADLAARDPFNRLHARQLPTRLDAEFIRDLALRIAGLLDPEVGGRSVYPYQPEGYLAALNFPRREWPTSAGSDLYRRSLYVHWQRTFVHPSLLAFDAPSREECTANRTVSNTPLQALVLLNDPIFVEAARVFAGRIMKEGGATFEQRLGFAFRAALSRSPRKDEIAVARQLYGEQKARYAADPQAAKALLTSGDSPPTGGGAEAAAWASVARTLLNLHETITRG